MKRLSVILLLSVLLLLNAPGTRAATPPETSLLQTVQNTDTKDRVTEAPGIDSDQKDTDNQDNSAIEENENETVKIADPFRPLNTVMFQFNDKLYFWVLKPVAEGYSKVTPEDIRLAVSNFFHNLTMPIRFVNNLLQLKMKDAGNEFVRFLYNTTAGVCGLADAAKEDLDIKRQDQDLGLTLGKYGIGHGFYIVWPVLGPSSLRDTAGRVGDGFLDPVSYITPWESAVGIKAYDKVNELSFRIGDYEDLKKAAIDPYVSVRNAYLQYRQKKTGEEKNPDRSKSHDALHQESAQSEPLYASAEEPVRETVQDTEPENNPPAKTEPSQPSVTKEESDPQAVQQTESGRHPAVFFKRAETFVTIPEVTQKSVVEKPQEKPAPQSPVLHEKPVKNLFHVQMGVFTNRGNAEVLEGNYKKKGYDAFVVESRSKDKEGKLYRVLIGKFKTKREAMKLSDTIRAKEKVDTIIFHE